MVECVCLFRNNSGMATSWGEGEREGKRKKEGGKEGNKRDVEGER